MNSFGRSRWFSPPNALSSDPIALNATMARASQVSLRWQGRPPSRPANVFRTTETFQRRHFGQMRDPIGTLAPEKSIPGPIFDMKRAGFGGPPSSTSAARRSQRPLPLYVSPRFPMQAPTAQAWAGGEMPLRLLEFPGHGKLRIPRSIPLPGQGTPLVGDSHRRPPS